MKALFLGYLFLMITTLSINAQDTIPHLEGRIKISIKKGTIECDVTLSNMPQLKNYYIRLNSGMNIRFIKNAEGSMLPLKYERSQEDSTSSGESSAYYIPAYNASGKYLPKAIQMNYVGMYPVITDTVNVIDWRGNIAFNGRSLRADGIQSAWSPILYDPVKDIRYEKVTYDLEIVCEDCKVIYVNGSKPVTGTQAKLKSNNAQDLTIFLGNFEAVAINGNYFLNPDANEEQLIALEKELQAYQDYLSKHLSIPYKGKSVYIQTTPVSKNNSWLFASYPTIVKVGWDEGMKSFINKKEGIGFRQYMAHELSHYYFGFVRTFNSPLGDMISEGLAEYLSLRITRDLISDSFYVQKLQSKFLALRNFLPLSFSEVRSKSDYQNRELYVYYYAPLIFSAIEKEIGVVKMWEWVQSLLKTSALFTDYMFLENTLNKVLDDKDKYQLIKEKYFKSSNSLQNAAAILSIQYNEQIIASATYQTKAKTYYYFFFSHPLIDIGSSNNRVIKHTEIMKIVATPEELRNMTKPIFKKMHDECENEAGCSSDFNTYDSFESAEIALKRWLIRHNKDGKLLVKVLKL